MNIDNIKDWQNEIAAKRQYWANEVSRTSGILSASGKNHPNRAKQIADWNHASDQLREYNKINKQRGDAEQLMFLQVVKDSMSKEVYNRVSLESKKRLHSHERKCISLLSESDEIILEDYAALKKKYSSMVAKIKATYKRLDYLTMVASESPTPEEWKNVQNFNRHLGKIKREFQEILIPPGII